MTEALYIVIGAAALVFVTASTARAVWYARHPMHLRWELYPVPHEAPARAAYGGSHFETSEWWRVPGRVNRWGEWAFMAREIAFLYALREFNRPLWYRSFPFHAGLYLLVVAVAGQVVEAALGAFTGGAPGGMVGALLRGSCTVLGATGLVLAVGGAASLLVYRRTNPALRAATTPGDLFNLVFFIVALGLVMAGSLTAPPEAPGVRAVAAGLLTWETTLRVPWMLATGLVLSALLAAYIPLTHMSHFIGKYFTYHAVRWNDQPLRGNAKIAAALAESLAYRSRWAAGHVASGQTASWADVVAADPTREAKR
jgi:nitrate reductase gamma subunit